MLRKSSRSVSKTPLINLSAIEVYMNRLIHVSSPTETGLAAPVGRSPTRTSPQVKTSTVCSSETAGCRDSSSRLCVSAHFCCILQFHNVHLFGTAGTARLGPLFCEVWKRGFQTTFGTVLSAGFARRGPGGQRRFMAGHQNGIHLRYVQPPPLPFPTSRSLYLGRPGLCLPGISDEALHGVVRDAPCARARTGSIDSACFGV